MYAVDIVFAGLMLLCLDGDSSPCPINAPRGYSNTAWILKADTSTNLCGWTVKERTRLRVTFSAPTGSPGDRPFEIVEGDCEYVGAKKRYECKLTPGKICATTDSTHQGQARQVDWLPRINDIDRSFLGFRWDYWSYTSSKIHFKNGFARAGAFWRKSGKLIQWERSDGVAADPYPGPLSDRLVVSYPGVTNISFTDCSTNTYLHLKPRMIDAQLTVENAAYAPYEPNEYTHNGYRYLTYLLWYHQLAVWPKCDWAMIPPLQWNEPVVLRCSDAQEPACNKDGDTTYWPVVLGPAF